MRNAQIIYAVIFLLSKHSIAHTNREPDSPSKNYKFSLAHIQETVRIAVQKADIHINILAENNHLESIANLYFKEYLDHINYYNNNYPKTVDILESYKTDLVNAYVLQEFKLRYPKLIYEKSSWMFNSVGGIYANMIVLYCSLTEYIVLWGTTLEADNKFSGYYPFMNEFDVMTRGVMYSHDVDAPGHASVIYKPIVQDGIKSDTVDTSNLIPKNVRSYYLAPHTYMVSYAQGNMAKAFLPGTLMPGTFVNQDWAGMKAHIAECARAYFRSKKKAKSINLEHKNYRAIWIIEEYYKIKDQKHKNQVNKK